MAETTEEVAVFKCIVLTPARLVYRAENVINAVLATTNGELEIQPRREPTLSPLKIGHLQLTELTANGEHKTVGLAINGGFLDMNGDTATIFAYSAELDSEIDTTRAQEAEKRARERLEKLARQDDKAAHLDEARVQRALARALNRMRLSQLNNV